MATKILGTTGDVTSCDCCGKQNLKKTVVLDVDDNIQYFGSTCAKNALIRNGHFAVQTNVLGDTFVSDHIWKKATAKTYRPVAA